MLLPFGARSSCYSTSSNYCGNYCSKYPFSDIGTCGVGIPVDSGTKLESWFVVREPLSGGLQGVCVDADWGAECSAWRIEA
jgi:hypothetical protein